jgi:hypothetical protein
LDEVLGLVALAFYILGIISLAAGVTYAVIRIFPTERKPKDGEAAESKPAQKEPASSDESSAAGSLFRRAKRERG